MATVKSAKVEWDASCGVFFVKVVYSNGTYTHCYDDDNGVFFYKEQASAEEYADGLLTREYDDNSSLYDTNPYLF